MTYKKKKLSLLSLMLIIAMVMMLVTACGGKSGGEDETVGTIAEEEVAEEEPAEEAEETEDEETAESANDAKVVDSLEEIDTEGMQDVPLQIESITLFEDGSLRIVPTEDLLKNAETNKELVDGAAYPFKDSGAVKAFYLVRYGNGGYRTVICLMEDGTLSALSAKELIEDRIFIVMDNITGRDTYVSVKQAEYEDAFGVVGVTEDGEEIELDFSLDF